MVPTFCRKGFVVSSEADYYTVCLVWYWGNCSVMYSYFKSHTLEWTPVHKTSCVLTVYATCTLHRILHNIFHFCISGWIVL